MNRAEVIVKWIRLNITRRPKKIDVIKKEGWTRSAPLYRCWCPEHGYFEDTPHGWDQVFTCPEC
ncbi:hypothetical protein ES702_02140 [subsurface metagenome]